ncbi:MAG: hypothetical protein JRI57_09780 [Deltaproteobacteria bacterium]|nr:hypothetical protein [Deltaproteobacteria bacterium]MBW1952025.1 hypothetical protein [Deltaproteobacteria bacterium]MBW1986089.1 hypothetical protein [Deltaproteobacteria bacterium]MBW2134225.1 hypothetical protein [Deltaproteobacteria bacterium]
MDLITALLDPQAYLEPTQRVDLIQTHISLVFLTDHHAYKVKKAVDLGFLNFTTLRRRHYFLNQELILNRRLAPEIYLEVLPIVARGSGVQIGGEGTPLEYALKMRRMPQEQMMDEVAARHELTFQTMDRIINKLVPFYQRAETGPRINKFGELTLIAYNHEENFARTEKYISSVLSREAFSDIVAYAWGFMTSQEAIFAERIRQGRIRDCHGDLHMRNICLANDIYIFDCIEFNPRFRYGDIVADISFLAMDLDFHSFRDLSAYFIQNFANAADDPDILGLVNFYKCYRAYIRGKINAFAAEQQEQEPVARQAAQELARTYFNLAWKYARKG